jgi:hypothetical protein
VYDRAMVIARGAVEAFVELALEKRPLPPRSVT